MDQITDQIKAKYLQLDQDPKTYLEGFLHSKPLNYWDYIEVDTLLSLQKPRTYFADETVFIMYHQITELVLKLMVHELQQITEPDLNDPAEISLKLGRLMRYTDLLTNSFSVMNEGMKYEDYNQFRLSLAPASGFQSAQFRIVEIYCTDLINLIPASRKTLVTEQTTTAEKFQFLYWQDAGYDRKTGKKSMTLHQFEEKYMKEFIQLADEMADRNLFFKYNHLVKMGIMTEELKKAFRDFDAKFNIQWPLVHLHTAHTYLGKGQAEKAATGGSHWEKYLHPKYQQRIFFPTAYTPEEIAHWGE
jgi:tryptophan 2,3-dioxygenase